MISTTVKFIVGLNGPVLVTTTLPLDSTIVGGVSGPYGTRHLLHLGRHFDHYYDRRRTLPVWQTRGIFSRLPRFAASTKAHSNDIKGQIGECLGALIMRRIVGLSTSEIEPLVVDSNKKTPDFRVYCQSKASELLTGQPTLPTIPDEWPLECKATPIETDSRKGFYDGLEQIATFWLLRGFQVNNTIGFGFISVAYNNLQEVNVHVVLPLKQDQLKQTIYDFHSRPFKSVHLRNYQRNFKTATSEVRTTLRNCIED